MKKILAALLCAALLLGHALAFDGKNYPAYDGSAPIKDAIAGSFAGESVKLEFDAKPEYSSAADGLVQACFFAFDEIANIYLELYLTLPTGLKTGDEISGSSAGADGASIALYEVTETSETMYYSGQMMGMLYPEGTDFEIKISAADESASAISMHGALSAQLCRFSGDFPTQEMISLSGVEFDFTLPLNGAAIPGEGGAPAPAFTLPPDHAAV